jgi:ElaB/YqjD/DUF883 family membrane-anchored ribosome-binding protein
MESWNQGMNRGESTMADAARRVDDTTERMSSRAHQTVDQVASAAHRVADRLSTNSEQWMASGDQMMQSFRDYVRERPFAALAAAVAIGFVLSRLSR